MSEEIEVFHKRCGEILRLALDVETELDFFISNYFCHPQSYKTFIFIDLMLVNTNFGRKVDIFREICKNEDIDEKEFQYIVESINFVKSIRNKVAHFESYIDNPEIVKITLCPRKSVKYKEDMLELTDELVEQIDRYRLFVIKAVNEINRRVLYKNKVQ